ncbi:MAG: hypothetical protein R3C56_13420 [Pirellulaceae bacterium]
MPINQMAIREVQEIFKSQFPDAQQEDVLSLANRLSNPFLKRFRTVLLVAENARHHVLGFAILLHEPELGFSYLDFMRAAKRSLDEALGASAVRAREQAMTWEEAGYSMNACLRTKTDVATPSCGS